MFELILCMVIIFKMTHFVEELYVIECSYYQDWLL
jgi:hypothetical protein